MSRIRKQPIVIRPHHKDYIASLVAEYKTPSQIIAAVKEKYNIVIYAPQVSRIAKKRKDVIDKARVAYLQDLVSIPIAQKKIRLKRTEQAYQKADEIKSPERQINAKIKCLERAQEETEGKTKEAGSSYYQIQQNVFANMSDKELLQERREILKQLKRIKVPVEVQAKEVNNAAH